MTEFNGGAHSTDQNFCKTGIFFATGSQPSLAVLARVKLSQEVNQRVSESSCFLIFFKL
jgi:hypothetical protein